MKTGDYVRTKKGTFDRFITSHTQENLTWYTFEDRGNITNPENYIIKSSPNIIDLIEAGDYVNGSRVLNVTIYGVYIEDGTTYGNTYIEEKDIKSIVTKEQFKNIEYKI